ncbi:hypothetical protein [Hyphomonas sp.]|uniref:hypothetical protein n=1 Tax=Hyphomonas sp. TaxID=87 RepID=UPI003F724B7C
MSEAFLSSLPRFDGDAARPSSSQLRLLLGQMPVDDDKASQAGDMPRAPVSSDPEPAVADPADNTPGRAPEFAEIEIMLSAMSGAIDRIERESREHAVRVTQAISAKLFPELSRLFLADEIGRHLPVMVPSSAPAVEIRAQPALLEKLRAAVEHMPGLADRCAVVPAGEDDDAEVRVSWETGGLTFDFDGLLKTCLAQLDSPQTTIEE